MNTYIRQIFIVLSFTPLLIGCNSDVNKESDANITHVPSNLKEHIKINSWIAFGPFEFDTIKQKPTNSILKDDLISHGFSENEINKDNIEQVKRTLTPKVIKEIDGFIDLFSYCDLPRENKSNYYLYTTLFSDCEQEVIFMFDYASSCNLWLNNEKIYTGRGKSGTMREIERFIRVKLKKGNNNLFLKINRGSNIHAWKFVFYISSIKFAKEVYRTNYLADFVENPENPDSLNFYIGPYKKSDIRSLFLEHIETQDLFEYENFANSKLLNSFKINLQGLNDGFYSCRLVLDNDTIEEKIYIGDLFELKKEWQDVVNTLHIDEVTKVELEINLLKFSNRLSNSRELTFIPNEEQRRLEKTRIFYAFSMYNLFQYIIAGDSTLKEFSGTCIKSYYSNIQQRQSEFLFHIDEQLIKCRDKIPLILVIPYQLLADDFLHEGYYNHTSQIENDANLASKNGFAIAWPFLGGKKTNSVIIEKDIEGVIKKLESDYNIDTNNICLLGDSEGATRALKLALKSPNTYKGLALFVPVGLPDFSYRYGAQIKRLKDIDVLIARPIEDKGPKKDIMDFIQFAKKQEVQINFKEYVGGHASFRKDHRRIGFQFLSNKHLP